MNAFKNIGGYLYDKNLTWVETVFLFLIGMSLFTYKLNEIEFYVDENPWIYESAALSSFLDGDFSPELWEKKYNGMLDPPMAKYLIGIGIHLGGVSTTSLPSWYWHLDYSTNVARGCVPSSELLWWARIPMVVVSLLGILFAVFLLSKAHSRLAALIFYIFCLTTFTYPLRQAMSEAPLIFFTFLAGIACYRGILALSARLSRAAFVRFSIFGLLTGLAVASKLNAIAIFFAGILCIGFVLFWKRKGEVKQGFEIALRLILVQAYLMSAVFIFVNPYLYSSPFRNTALMFIARAFTIQVQTKMYPPSVVTAENWLRIVPARIFEQLSTPAYPGHYVINIVLFCIGVYAMFRALSIKLPGWEAALLLISLSIALAVPGMLTPLDWDRYYLFPVLFSRMFIAIGLAKALSVLFQKTTKMWKSWEGSLKQTLNRVS